MKKPKFIPEFADIPTARTKMPELGLEDRRLNFKEVELGFTEELARAEAARCLSCRRCIGCGLCLAECDQCAIVYEEQEAALAIEADAIVFTSDGQASKAGRKRDLGYGAAWNVITSLEFERLVSPTGPFGGLLVRPSDGETPRRIAFIQCVGSRDEAIGANYCSVECCSRTLSQAHRAREVARDVEVCILHRGLRPFGKTSELDLGAVTREKWARLVEATVASVKEDPATGSVAVSYVADGAERTESFDLVVLAVGVESNRDFRRHARLAGVGVTKYGFVDSGVAGQITCKEGVAFAGAILGPEAGSRSALTAIGAASRALGRMTSPAPPRSGASDPASASSEAPRVAYACEYGLQLAGQGNRDVQGVRSSLADELQAAGIKFCGSQPFLCYKEGREALRRDLGPGSALVVLGCHRGSHEDLFERVLGLARGAVTILDAGELAGGAESILAALASVPAACGPTTAAPATAAATEAEAAARTVAILGGGVSGLAAAGELARRGVKVIVIEKTETVGANLAKATITGEPADAGIIEDFVTRLEAHPGVRMVRSARPVRAAREGGLIKLAVATPDGTLAVEAGALIVATGASPAAPADAGFTDSRGVITQAAFRAALAAGDAPWRRIVMLQCVGARDEGYPYCSRYCCREALVNALAFKHLNPQAEVTILHKGIRVFGLDEELYSDAIERGIGFVEIDGKPAFASQASAASAGGGEGAGALKVSGKARGGKPFGLTCDALVLSLAHSGARSCEVSDLVGAPLDKLGFVGSANPLFQPFAARAEGVFVCGFARNPVTVEEAFAEGIGAAGAVCRYLVSR